ncbi:MAG: tRNA uridine-5-carboxymethylaminomethyl(34) synthesis GTPase MnmE, partial [Candidatus Omnitrophota bacterium]
MSHPKIEETIAAIATPVGVGGMSVIRVSGERAFAVVDRVFRPQKGRLLEFAAQTLHFGEVVRESGALVDRAMVGLFRSPQSYTGEDVVEISVHGGLVVSRAVLDLLLRGGARLAEPGEFTKRAFLNGKIDLTQAEA